MRNTMKKILAVILTLVISLSSMSITAFAAAPTKPATPTATSSATSVTLKWKKVSKAKGYCVYSYNTSTKKSTKIATTSKLTYKKSKLSGGKTYCYYIKAYNLKGKKKVFSKASSKVYISTKPATPTAKVSSYAETKVDVSWGAVAGATKYVVQCSTSSDFSKALKSTTTTSKTATFYSLNPSTKYYFRVRALRVYNKKNYYSAYSTTVYATTKKKTIVIDPTNPYPDYNTNVTKSTLNTSVKYQTMLGFGASGGWWSKRIGTWSKSEIKQILTYLYSKDNGIGLNIYRYNLGAGSAKTGWNEEHPTNVNEKGEGDASMDPYKSVESFVDTYDEKTQSFTYNWDNDFAQRECLRIANELCPNMRVTLFMASPPVELTINKRAGGYFSDDFSSVWFERDDRNEIIYTYSNDTTVNLYVDEKDSDGNIISFKDDNGNTVLRASNPYGIIAKSRWEKPLPNLDEDNYQPFSDYAIACGNKFVDWGYRVTDISPVNEPEYACWNTSTVDDFGNKIEHPWLYQEGCHYDREGNSNLRGLLVNMIETQQANEAKNSKYDYKISMFDGGSARGEDGDFAGYFNSIWSSSTCRNYFDSVSVHAYWTSAKTKQECADYLTEKGKATGKQPSVRLTEYCQMYGDVNTGIRSFLLSEVEKYGATNAEGINAGVAMAKIINDDLTILNGTEWDWWTCCSNGIYPDGLVYVDNKDHSHIETAKRLWCLGNYSKFIDEGATRIGLKETNSVIKSCAFVNPDGSIAVVYVNNGAKNVTSTINTPASKKYEVYTTSATYDLAKTASGTTTTATQVSIPSQSVVTLVIK